MKARTFVLGGVRSGKSAYAENLAVTSGKPMLYLATAQCRDEEMRQRVSAHRARRAEDWRTVEEPLDIVSAITDPAHQSSVILIDCLTLWLSNLMEAQRDIKAESAKLAQAIAGAEVSLVLVSSEVGMGIVPEHASARLFRDHAGTLHQQVARACDHVVFMVAGLPMVLK